MEANVEAKIIDPFDYGNLDAVIKRIRTALKARSGKAWSVSRGKGTAYCWITITSPPARRGKYGEMTDADRDELCDLLGFERSVHRQGESIPASSDYRREYVARAEGQTPTVYGQPYWD